MTILENLKRQARELNCYGIACEILDDQRFPIWSGSSKQGQHHYGKGGLIRHTDEVIQLCLLNNVYFEGSSKHLFDGNIFLAALFHDAGKMWDYEPLDPDEFEYKEWQGTTHKRNVHHITRSALVWQNASNKHGYNHIDDEILHAILAHHGQREWGSPVAPNTRLAWLLHLCDGISARMDDVYTFPRIK